MKYQPYVYYWVYKPTGHWYIGSRTAKGCYPGDGYKTSSEIVKEGLQVCPNDWEQQIFTVETAEEALLLEEQLLNDLNAKDDSKCLNQTNGGNKGEIILKAKPWKIRQKDTLLEDFYLKRLNNNVEERTTQGEHNE
jgi:hypothetical protein